MKKVVITGFSSCMKSSILDQFYERGYHSLYSDSKMIGDLRKEKLLDFSYNTRMLMRYSGILTTCNEDSLYFIERTLIDQLCFCKLAVIGPWDICCDPEEESIIKNEDKYLHLEKKLNIDKYYFLEMTSPQFITSVVNVPGFMDSWRSDCFKSWEEYQGIQSDSKKYYMDYLERIDAIYEIIQLPDNVTFETAYKVQSKVYKKIINENNVTRMKL